LASSTRNIAGAPADPFLDQDLDSLATLGDRGARRQAAGNVAGQLAQDLPAVFLYAPTLTFVVRTTLTGVTVPTTGGGAARFDLLPSWRRG
jgi:ABC-type transport system substrate-binding protein